jgi:hypothetical protein
LGFLADKLGVNPKLLASKEKGDLNQHHPTEYRADTVLSLRESVGTTPTMMLVVEVQRSKDEGKCYSWPLYVAETYGRFRCPTNLVIFCEDEKTAEWAREPSPGFMQNCFRPIVIGPAQVPKLTSAAGISKKPGLGLLSLLFHAEAIESPEIAKETLKSLLQLSEKTNRTLYVDMVFFLLQHLNQQELQTLREVIMSTAPKYEYKSDFFKSLIQEGKTAGKAEGEALAVLRTLRRRNIASSEEQRQRILSCTDLATLEAWAERAYDISHIDELWEEGASGTGVPSPWGVLALSRGG